MNFLDSKIHHWILVNITHRISFKNPRLHFLQTRHAFGSDFIIIIINWAISLLHTQLVPSWGSENSCCIDPGGLFPYISHIGMCCPIG